MIMSENNVMQYLDDYGYSHSLFNKANFTDSTIGKLLRIFDGLPDGFVYQVLGDPCKTKMVSMFPMILLI